MVAADYQLPVYIFDRADIDTARRLRGDDQLHVAFKLARHHHLLLVAARQAAGTKIDAWRAHVIAEARRGGAGVDPLPVDLHAGGDAVIIIAVQHHVLGDGEIADHARFVAILGNMRDAHAVALAHARAGDVPSGESDLAGGHRRQSGDGLDKLGLAIALDAGDADNLAAMNAQIDIGKTGVPGAVEQADPGKSQHGVARRGVAAIDREAYRSANHHLGEVRLGKAGRVALPDNPPLAQHADPVGDLENFVKLVGDEDNALAGIAERPHDGEELLDLLRGQDRGRLIEDQNIGRPEENLQNFHPLLDSNRQTLDQLVGRHLHAVARVDVLNLCPRRREIQKIGALCRLDAEDHILDDAEHRHQHEMLMHHADPAGDAVAGAGERHRLAINEDVAGIGAVEPGQDVHQGGFAGPVLTKKAKHLAGADVQVDILVRLHRAETLADAAQLDIHEIGSQKRSRCPRSSGGNGQVTGSAAGADRTGDQAVPDLFDLGLQRRRHLVIEMMIGGEANTVILQVAKQDAAAEAAIHGLLDDLHNGRVHPLQNRGEIDMRAVRVGLRLVGVNADNHQRITAKLVGKRGRTETNRAGDRHHDVGALIIEVLGEGAAVIKALEIAGEQTFLACRVPAKNLHIGALLAVVVGDAVIIAVHEGGHRWDVDAAKGTDNTRFGHARRQISGKESGLVGRVDLTDHVRDRGIIGKVNNRIFLARIGLGRCLGGITHEEANRDNDIAFAFDQRIQVRLVIRLRLRFQIPPLDTIGGHRVLDALPSGLVEAGIIDTTNIRHLTGGESRCAASRGKHERRRHTCSQCSLIHKHVHISRFREVRDAGPHLPCDETPDPGVVHLPRFVSCFAETVQFLCYFVCATSPISGRSPSAAVEDTDPPSHPGAAARRGAGEETWALSNAIRSGRCPGW